MRVRHCVVRARLGGFLLRQKLHETRLRIHAPEAHTEVGIRFVIRWGRPRRARFLRFRA